ncbi:mitochondrial ribosomal protein subunit L20-domain-containing protein [Abortiporus biennis]|nr:mitochondrial ribosomal protein subunit L20-domain-containing protein [Abortiporus biennis]
MLTKGRSVLRAAWSRSYSSRLPQRPLARFPDPLQDVAHQPLPDDLTFIHRPPPSAPSPLSYTTSPVSPLLKAEVTPKDGPLPPPMKKTAERPLMSREDMEKLRKLRSEDPIKWTRGALAKEFNCTRAFVMRIAPLPTQQKKKALAQRSEEHEKNREQWGEKKFMVREIRRKRRELW